MKTIVHRSVAIVTFIGLLGLTFSAPQTRHLERLADLLVMAPVAKPWPNWPPKNSMASIPATWLTSFASAPGTIRISGSTSSNFS